jgi:hypothetical protein
MKVKDIAFEKKHMSNHDYCVNISVDADGRYKVKGPLREAYFLTLEGVKLFLDSEVSLNTFGQSHYYCAQCNKWVDAKTKGGEQ